MQVDRCSARGCLGTHFALFIEESSDIGTGMAVFKPDEDTVVELRDRDESGDDPWDGGFVTWTSFTQEALTIPEWFEPVPDDQKEFLSDFRGVLFLRMEDGSEFAPLGLRFGKKKGSLSAVPVIITAAGEDEDCPAPNPFGGC